MVINFTHLHLLLNHFPILGTIFAFMLLIYALIRKSDELLRTAYGAFIVTALLSIPAYMSGVGAAESLENAVPGISNDVVKAHESAGMLALLFVLIVGGVAVMGLWKMHAGARTSGWTLPAVLILSVLTLGLTARTGNLGGAIRHPEAYGTGGAAADEGALGNFVHKFEPDPQNFALMMTSTKWWWAFMMDLHFIGLILIMGTIAMFDLRVLGFAKQLPIAALDKLIPWGLLGLALNITTGVLAFMGMPRYYSYDTAFWFKMLALVLAGANLLLFYASSAFRDCVAAGSGDDAPPFAKLLAASSIVLWFAVIILGRYIQFFEDTVAHPGA